MLIPIGHESNIVRRLPWVTFIIMASCLVIHIFIFVDMKEVKKDLESSLVKIRDYYIYHPYLDLDPEIEKLFFGERSAEDIRELLSLFQGSKPDRLTVEDQQETLDQLTERFKQIMGDIPFKKWGFTPAKKSFTGLLTYMFIHAGWLHLLGNLLFLYLTGPFIEDVWGRPVFTSFYLIMGMLSAFMYAQHYPNSTGPLIGASGAIFGVVGAFLIKYWNTKIVFFYFFFFLIRGTFKAPAWLMIPLWFLLELFNAKAMDSVKSGGGGVAHWAHVWGFVFGVAVGIGMKVFKVEEKYISPKIESKMSYVDERIKILQDALKKKLDGKYFDAYAVLLGAASKYPSHREIGEELWSLSIELGKENEAARFYIALIESEIRRGQMDLAINHFKNLKMVIPQSSISQSCKVMLMQHLTKERDFKEAAKLADELLKEMDLSSSPGSLLTFARTALELSPLIAKRVIEVCIQHPEIPSDQKDELKAKLEGLGEQ